MTLEIKESQMEIKQKTKLILSKTISNELKVENGGNPKNG